MILCGGENLMDLLPEAPDPAATPDRALRFRAVPGGAPCNCARALARLGTAAGYLAPVSTDAFGAALAEGLERDGVVLAGGRSDLPTALAVVTLTEGGPVYAFHREGTADRDVTPAGLLEALPEDAAALCLSGMALA
ncbi:hypothetical protein CCR87_02420, partial [Rhodobaculum claviforme]|nr:hypothetical protein [Rhodobaculum claviforme]